MAKRNKTSEQLSAYLDGELTAKQAATLEASLTEDSALAAELDLLQAALGHRRRLSQLHWGGGTPTYL